MARWVGRLMAVIMAAGVAAGCGGAPPAHTGATSHGVYVVANAEVWRVVREEIERAHGEIAVDEPLAGRMESVWKLYDQTGEPKQLGAEELRPGDAGFRVIVRVREATHFPGGWRVWVDGRAAKFVGADLKPVAYERGHPREPDWVQRKIDRISRAIHARLSEYDAVGPRAGR